MQSIFFVFITNFITAYSWFSAFTEKWYPGIQFCRAYFHKSRTITETDISAVDKKAYNLWSHISWQLKMVYSNVSTVYLLDTFGVKSSRYHTTSSLYKNWIFHFLCKERGLQFLEIITCHTITEKTVYWTHKAWYRLSCVIGVQGCPTVMSTFDDNVLHNTSNEKYWCDVYLFWPTL